MWLKNFVNGLKQIPNFMKEICTWGDGPKTPHFHWETLTNKIDPKRRKALKALDIVPKQ